MKRFCKNKVLITCCKYNNDSLQDSTFNIYYEDTLARGYAFLEQSKRLLCKIPAAVYFDKLMYILVPQEMLEDFESFKTVKDFIASHNLDSNDPNSWDYCNMLHKMLFELYYELLDINKDEYLHSIIEKEVK